MNCEPRVNTCTRFELCILIKKTLHKSGVLLPSLALPQLARALPLPMRVVCCVRVPSVSRFGLPHVRRVHRLPRGASPSAPGWRPGVLSTAGV